MKRSFRILLLAVYALRRNILRAVLTVLGIVIGIAAVIAMMEIGNGSAKAIQNTISAMGANTILILPGMAASAGVSWGSGSEMTLMAEDAASLKESIDTVKAAAPIVRGKGQLIVGNRNWVPNTIYGSSLDFLVARGWKIKSGESFTERDIRNATKVCLIGETIVRQLFEGESPLGKEIRLSNVSFKVIGTLVPKGANMMGSDQDDTVIIPWTSLKFRVSATSSTTTSSDTSQKADSNSLYPAGTTSFYPPVDTSGSFLPSKRLMNVDQILVAISSAQEIDSTIEKITQLLRQRHRIREGKVDDFTIRNMTEMTQAMSSTSRSMTNLLLSVALISLLVGGVGIMNIMLVSVTERTKEIGLRMAVGAKGSDILKQFLAEAIVLCLAGGILGLIFGKLASILVRVILSWPTESSLGVVIAAIGVSAGVGIIFGFFPAWKGSRLDPIQALRHE